MVSCGPGQYNLTISTTEGNVTTTGLETHTYDEGTVATLLACPCTGYRFVEWTGAEVDDPDAATTSIIMGRDAPITANGQYLDR